MIQQQLESEDILNHFSEFEHDYRYANSLRNVNFDQVFDQYFKYNNLPSFTFTPSFTETKRGSCYDLSLLAYNFLSPYYNCDILHLGWTPKIRSSYGVLSCMHTVCRYFTKPYLWNVFQGFIFKGQKEIWGPYHDIEEFASKSGEKISSLVHREVKITFIDRLSFEDKKVPTRIQGLYPTEEKETSLGYWII
jgi:hypothetical protein